MYICKQYADAVYQSITVDHQGSFTQGSDEQLSTILNI